MSAGRFAPTPSGHLHLGNLRTGVAAWLDARAHGERFVMRIEDIDRERTSPQMAADQLRDLEVLGLDWDEVYFQHDRFDAYAAALDRLSTFICQCTRRDLRDAARAPHTPPDFYPGTCRNLGLMVQNSMAVRFAGPEVVASELVTDELMGQLGTRVDMPVLARIVAAQPVQWGYNLAVVVDDIYSQVTRVVRGADLAAHTATYVAIWQALTDTPPPAFVHVPLVVTAEGERLAKRTAKKAYGTTLPELLAEHTLGEVVTYLGRSLGLVSAGESVESVAELVDCWSVAQVPRQPWVFERCAW